MTWPVAVALISALCNGTAGVLSCLRGRSDNVHRSFAGLGFSFAFWSLAYAGAAPGFDDPFWMKLLYTPLSWLPGASLSFIWSFTGLPEASRRRRTVPLYLAGAGLLAMLWSGTISPETFRVAFLACGVPIFGLGLVLLWLHWQRSTDAAERNRRGYLLAASCIAAVGGLMDFLPLTGLEVPKTANLALMLYSLIVLGAISLHHLLDLRAAAGQAAVLVAASLLLGLLLTGIEWLTRWLEGPLLLNFFLLCLLLMACLPWVWDRLKRWIFSRERRGDDSIAEFERETARALDREAVASAARKAVQGMWGAQLELLWVDQIPKGLPKRIPSVATLESLGRENGSEPLREVLAARKAEAMARVEQGGGLLALLLLAPPAQGFYDLHAVRWLERFAAAFGRAVRDAETSAGLLHADRLAQIGVLAAGIAHEVRNPLSAMRGAAELLEGHLAEEQRREYLAVLSEEIQRLDGMVSELLDYASPRVHEARSSWSGVWQRLEKLLRSDWPAHVKLECGAEEALLAVSGVHLHQMMLNLLRNSLQAAEQAKDPAVRVTLSVQERWVCIAVEDTGPGIPAEILPRLFTPFASASEGGTGLGLATVKRLAELYNGRVWAENLPSGARFTLLLPRA